VRPHGVAHPEPTATRVSRAPGLDARPTDLNTPSFQRFSRRTALAWALLVLAPVMAGCLLPQDYRFSDDPPPFRNNPVRVVLPPEPGSIAITTSNGVGGGRGCSLEFVVLVTDPDLDDPITVQWFVDYNKDTNPNFFREELLFNTGSPVRGPARLRMDLGSPGNPLFPSGLHVLELLVADGQIVNRIPQPKSQDPDAGVNPTFVDGFAWAITVEAGDCPLP